MTLYHFLSGILQLKHTRVDCLSCGANLLWSFDFFLETFNLLDLFYNCVVKVMQPLLLLVDDVLLLLQFLELTSLPHYGFLVLFNLLIFLRKVLLVLVNNHFEA